MQKWQVLIKDKQRKMRAEAASRMVPGFQDSATEVVAQPLSVPGNTRGRKTRLVAVRQEGRGQGTATKRMMQHLAPRQWVIQLPVDPELQYTLIYNS